MTGSIDALKLACLRCGHSWLRRSEKLPLKCPKCLSARWDKPKKEKVRGR